MCDGIKESTPVYLEICTGAKRYLTWILLPACGHIYIYVGSRPGWASSLPVDLIDLIDSRGNRLT